MHNSLNKLEDYYISLNNQVEAHFEYSNNTNLLIKTLCPSQNQLDYLDHQIIKQPKDIKSHVRKIGLLIHLNAESDALFASLIDFFTVVKQKAQAIKKRLLISARANLDKTQFNYLAEHFVQKSLTADNVLNNIQERLLFEFSQEHTFIQHKSNLNTDNADQNSQENMLKATIYDYLENSQIDLALDQLESSLSDNPQLLEMGELLVKLYKSTNDPQRFKEFYKHMTVDKPTLAPFWQETADYFISMENTK